MENKTKITDNQPLLSIKDLSVYYEAKEIGTCKAVNNVSFDIMPGETIGIVGETGAGKTTIAYSILQLLQSPPGKVKGGQIFYKGKDLLKESEKEMHKIRGYEISMIFQDPMTALNPLDTVGQQISEVVLLHNNVSKQEAAKLAGDMMEMVGIPRTRYGDYPHEFSGGMKQRIVIAMALVCQPKLLIADEPTTALDVTIQAQVLDLIRKLKEAQDTSLILITHDLGVVAETCDEVAVVYAGEIIEHGSLAEIYDNPVHPYTIGLFGAIPDLNKKVHRLSPIEGLPPDPTNLPQGCYFAPRCPKATKECHEMHPTLKHISGSHYAFCNKI